MRTLTTTLLKHKLAVILLIAIGLRLGVLLVFDDIFAFERTGAIHGSDAYDDYAQNLLTTGVYGRTAGVPDAAIPPLYSYVLAVVYGIFGRGFLQVGLFHILLDVASITMVYHTARRLLPAPTGEQVGALAGLLYAVYPYLIFQNLTLIDTPFFMFLLHAFVLLMVMLRQRPAWDRDTFLLALVGGLVLGLSVMARPITPPLAILVAVWFLLRLSMGQMLQRLIPVALVSTLVLTPWIVRNYEIFDAFVPMTTTSGSNLWQGNNERVIPYFRAGYDVQWTGPDEDLSGLDARTADARRFALAIQWLSENRDKIPELLWVKFLVHWSIDVAPRYNPTSADAPRLDYVGDAIEQIDESGEIVLGGLPPGDPVDAYSEPLFDQLGRMIHRFYWGPLLLLGLAGMVLSWRHWRELSLIFFVQISMTLVYMIFHPSTRYRVPSDPLYFIYSAYALVWLWYWWQNRRPAA